MCSSNKCSRIWGGDHEEQRSGDIERIPLFPRAIPAVLKSQLFCEGSRALVPFLCDCCHVCLLCVISPVTMTEEQLYKVCYDKAGCVHAAALFLPLQ